MKYCAIYPIPLSLVAFNTASMLNTPTMSRPIFMVVYAWYIEGAKKKILVDSGVNPEFSPKAGPPSFVLQTIESGLHNLGIVVNDIDILIQTHLHFDHIAYAYKFPQARIIVQKRELEFARNPHPIWGNVYYKQLFDGIDFEVIDGDLQIIKDVKLLLTPGHSPGGQSVSVRTDEGIAVIASLCTTMDNYDPPAPPAGEALPVVIPRIHTDIYEAYDSLLRIKETADIIVPLHDSSFLTKKVIP